MNVGSIVYATDQGLGILAKSFYDHGIITDVIVVRHGRHPTHDEWYPGAHQVANLKDWRQQQAMAGWCEGMDVMLFLETPFVWELIDHCRSKGVKTVLMPMFECEPTTLPACPDLVLCPSLLDLRYYSWYVGSNPIVAGQMLTRKDGLKSVFLPVPVEYPWRQRTRAEVFVHNAGHGGLKGRNGTAELIEAMRHVKSGARLTLRAQESSRQYWAAGQLRDANNTPVNLPDNIDLKIGTFPYEQLFAEGDVFVFPETFNGLSLPLQEARAAGMLVMCGDRFPMNTWLPTKVETPDRYNPFGGFPRLTETMSPLIPVEGYVKSRIGPPYNEFDEAVFSPKTIAAKIDEWYVRDITEYSQQGREWAEENSWEVLGPKYKAVLEGLCASST